MITKEIKAQLFYGNGKFKIILKYILTPKFRAKSA